MSCDYCDGTLVDKVFGGPCSLCVPNDAPTGRSWQNGTRFPRDGRKPSTALPARERYNRYQGVCKLCGGIVEAMGGILRKEGTSWTVEHKPGECQRARHQTSNSVVNDTVDVPNGRYALDTDHGVEFFVVEHGREGSRWQGRIFVSQQAGDSLFPVRDPARRASILTAIAADTHAALMRYGQECGVCGACGRTLTDEESRRLGIGPVCRAKGGW